MAGTVLSGLVYQQAGLEGCLWLATGFLMLIAARMVFGLTQAGCYPTSGSLIKRWAPLPVRGTASSIVSFGGRVGGATAPLLTAWLLKDYLSWRAVLLLRPGHFGSP